MESDDEFDNDVAKLATLTADYNRAQQHVATLKAEIERVAARLHSRSARGKFRRAKAALEETTLERRRRESVVREGVGFTGDASAGTGGYAVRAATGAHMIPKAFAERFMESKYAKIKSLIGLGHTNIGSIAQAVYQEDNEATRNRVHAALNHLQKRAEIIRLRSGGWRVIDETTPSETLVQDTESGGAGADGNK